MTLIAALPVLGVPVLIGDLLISRTGAETGFRRKTTRIADNLAIAWTGSELGAMIVADALSDKLGGTIVTRAELDATLTSLPPDDLRGLEVILVGWLIDVEQHCFLWRSNYPSEVFTADHYVMGSGRDAAAGKLGRGHPPQERLSHSTPAERCMEAVKMTLFHCGMLTSDEVGARRHRTSYAFGHFYEIAFWNTHRFEFITDVTYVFDGLIMSADGSEFRHEVLGRVLRYHQLEEHAIVEDRNYEKRVENVSVARPITPNPTPRPSERPIAKAKGVERLPLDAEFTVIHTLAHRKPDLFVPSGVMVFHKDDDGGITSVLEIGDPPDGFYLEGGSRFSEAVTLLYSHLERELRN